MQRRTFLAGGLAASLSLKSVSSRAAAEPTKLDIIDCHTHFYDPSRPEGVAWPGKGTPLYRTVLPKDLRALKQYRPVTGTVIVEASPRLEDNAWLLELAKTDPFVVGIVGHLKPGEPEFASHVKRFAADPLYRGIRVGSATVKTALEKNDFADLKMLADHDLALDVNGGPDTPALVAQLAAKLPQLRIVQNHIGNVAITKDAPPSEWQAGIQAAAKHANVFCKISALVEGAGRGGKKAPTELDFYRPYIDVVWNAFGDERVVYGSNWPVSDNAADYYTLQRIALEYASTKGDAAVKNFCALNAKRAYKWVERPGRLK
ncbi:MAG: amidohydrolase [Planctomycetia bacterium]|nr:amidohydrolase [Planctomycetia bacterium]